MELRNRRTNESFNEGETAYLTGSTVKLKVLKVDKERQRRGSREEIDPNLCHDAVLVEHPLLGERWQWASELVAPAPGQQGQQPQG